MTVSERGQVSATAAEVYEEFFVPALFQQWAPRVATAARVGPGQRVLDVACGTGILARTCAARVQPGGTVVGLDANEGMLAVARRLAPQLEWRQGAAEALPFAVGHFDAVVSQFGLMFFADRPRGIAEMIRVLRPGGRLAVAVWDAAEHSPGYAAMIDLLQRLFGERVAGALRVPFVLGDPRAFHALFADTGLRDVVLTTLPGTARFPSIQAWIYTDVRGWTLADLLDDAQFARLLAEAERVMQPFVTADGTVAFDTPAHILSATKA
jgi:ubiquinone/menaquinone biosynthesis C-methylase UbiE